MTLFAGRYTLHQKLASGGMAEVFLARQQGISGFEKLVVLKRILPHHSGNPEFVRMFLNEARTAADLSHPNLVSIFDAGCDDGAYFITMEYLRGKDLGAVFKENVRRRQPLPVGVSAHLLIDIARGLHAAHTKTDLEGRALEIVHRDVSPQNLFATWDGVAKVLDFGIAHASTGTESSEVGVIKGKIAYLSPEQLEGDELDGRSDQFALGIVAWELLTNRRLFHRPSDAEVLRAVLEHRVPRPTTVEPTLPREVEAIVMRMLAERRHDRFGDCAAVADAFEAWLDDARVPHSAARTGAAISALFAQTPAQNPEPPAEPTELVRRDVTTRSDRKRARLPQEEDFLSAVSSFLGGRPPRTSNLVPPSTPFIGRERDLSAVEAQLEGGARCVTLVGFGGVGKTRLAHELAWRSREKWKGGAWFCDLADARTADAVCKALAQALKVEIPLDTGHDDSITLAGRTLDALGPALVVLDNFEQVVTAAPQTVGRWLALAPAVRFVVTTREALGIPLEVTHPLAPLPDSEAVRLFVARARLAGYEIAPDELPVVGAICAKLEGHALAIELAAPNLLTLSAAQLLERLQQRFDLLGVADTSKGRQGTLWNAIDWSWQLLERHEQVALAQLSVCRGGFTPESGVAVIDLTAFALAAPRLETIIALHRKSLLNYFVVPDAPRELRLKMLESVWEFATRKLEELGDLAGARARHAEHYLELGGECVDRLNTAESEAAMGRLFAERENLSEVFERALATLPPTPRSAEYTLRAMHTLEPMMQRKGPYASHVALLDEAIRVAQTIGVSGEALATGLRQRGNAWRVRGRFVNAVHDLEEAHRIARTTPDERLVARIGCDLAVARFVSGQLDAALAGLEEANGFARRCADAAALVETLAYLAIVRAARGELALAIAHCDEALPIARSRGDRMNEARLLGTMGNIFHEQERLELAGAFLRDSVQRCRAIHEVRLQGYFLGKFAHIHLERGEMNSARVRLTEALSLMGDVGDLRHEGLFLTYVGTLEAMEKNFDTARVTMGSAKLRLDSVNDALLLAALELRVADVDVRAGADPTHARALLERAAVHRSDEVRLAARVLQRSLPS